jgi:NADP-dependent alcohol dehydrogenase
MQAVAQIREGGFDFLLAVGGGSVADGCKYIAASACHDGPGWDIVTRKHTITQALPLGVVLTLAATGSESNGAAVITQAATHTKAAFMSPLVQPKFAVLDPATLATLPDRQLANGVVDAFVHVCEQYITHPVNAPLQDRQAEAILSTLIDEGPRVLAAPEDYASRANVMWCATQALNGTLSAGVPGDWSTHGIGHELTALYGLDHAQTLAVVMPGVWRHRFERKKEKLAQYGRRVWELSGDAETVAFDAILRTEAFFEGLGVPTRLPAYGIDAQEAANRISARFAERGTVHGEHKDMGPAEVRDILLSRG